MPLVHLDARAHLVDALRYDLIGPMLPDELIELRPTRWYLTGFLVPKGATDADYRDPTDNEELGAGFDTGQDDDAGGDDQGAARPGWFPSSFGMTLLVPADADHLHIKARWGQYHRLDAEQSVALWAEHQPERLEALRRPRRPVDGTEADGDAEPRLRAPPPLWQRSPYEGVAEQVPLKTGAVPVKGGPGLVLHLRVAAANSPGLPPGTRAVSVFLVNERDPVEGPTGDERVLFQAELTVTCPAGLVARTDWSGLDSKDPDAERADLQYRDHGEWAVGHGVSTEVAEGDGDRVTSVRTTWLPQGTVRRMQAVTVPGVPLSMEELAKVPDAAALAAMVQPLLDEYTGWIGRQRAQAVGLTSGRQATAEALMARAEIARDRIADGLDYLAREEDAFEAFRIANQAMALASRRVRPDKEPRWRLFQLAFVLLNVASAGDAGHRDREVVELLFFPTGGGKTEAYLGVAAYVMVLRRLRGLDRPDEGAGVAVLLRYTLRLLTLDQLSRAATLVCALEVLRRDDARLGRRRFGIGLWVGRSGTDNRMVDAEKRLSMYRSNPRDPRRSPGVPLVSCPWCRTPFTPDCFNIEKRGSKPWALRVGCADFDCDFHVDNSDQVGLPVSVVDEQVYRELPTFLLATVDKFAVLPWRGAAGTLFGRVAAGDPDGFYAVGEAVPGSARRLPEGLRPPELIVQDELHLITGPLGTMVGLYETVIDRLSRDAAGRPPKILASTATARRASQQIRALYARPVVELFPPPGLDPDDTFFARVDEAETATRRYLGVAAPGRSMKAVAVRVYSTLLAAAYKDWKPRGSGLENPADTYCTLVSYFNTLRELGGAQRMVQEEVAPRAARLDERHALQEKQSPWCLGRHLSFDVLELTSRQSTDQIRQATGRLRAPYQSDIGGRNDVLLASSMISVGVDIPRLGLMVMNGQPKTVAEYIQATSRVGRETPGLVVTVHNLRRPRDRSHYERFTAFHAGFYRMVEAASVTPFSSRAIDRGLAGVVVALARHGWRLLTPPKAVDRLDTVANVPNDVAGIVATRLQAHAPGVQPGAVAHVQQRVQSLFSDWSGIVHSLVGAGVPLVYSPWEIKGGEPLLSTAVDPPSPKDARLVRFRAPTSMRDVEPGVHLWVEHDLGGED
ncbi:MAG: hypothetical protein H6741_27830 [Alphaproteobacteria bacterium]|nr:hypothetical protein [Alphaproteobacteria bacterium]MCB9796525.1 hypothetical protein [Alphaproteobacteria bacterium]